MRLAAKLIIFLAVISLGSEALVHYIADRRQISVYLDEEREDISNLITAMRSIVIRVKPAPGDPRLTELIIELAATDADLEIRWVWFDAGGEEQTTPMLDVQAEDIKSAKDSIHFPALDVIHDEVIFAYGHVHLPTSRRFGGVEVTEKTDWLGPIQASMYKRMGVLWSVFLVLAIGLIWILGRRWISGPAGRMNEKMQQISRGEITDPLEIRGRDELSRLGKSLNAMCEELARSRKQLLEETVKRMDMLEQLRHADRLRVVGHLATGVAHEVGTPLNVISGRSEMIARGALEQDKVIDNAKIIKEQSDRIAKIMRQLLNMARLSPPEVRSSNVLEIVTQTAELLEPLAGQRETRIELVLPDTPAMAPVDPGQTQQVLNNLIMNAIQSMENPGTVKVRVTTATAPRPDDDTTELACVRIDIEDEGVGIPAEFLPQVFDPYFTTKTAGEGLGIGLSVADGIVREHGGWIEVSSEPSRGSCFSVFLPQEPKA